MILEFESHEVPGHPVAIDHREITSVGPCADSDEHGNDIVVTVITLKNQAEYAVTESYESVMSDYHQAVAAES